jgi:(p)ppGpp synthase/HD superfamily hydrolase
MTPEQAKQLCIDAHKEQLRRPQILATTKIDNYCNVINQLEFTKVTETVAQDGSIFNINEKGVITVQQPYSSHPIAVADMMDTDEEKIVAYLHDVIEDTAWKFVEEPLDDHNFDWQQYLVYKNKKIEIPLVTSLYLLVLTHNKNQSYTEYIKQITQYRLTTKIKLADIFHNLSSNPTDKQKAKYMKALPILLKTL